jgi:hypothetical protein
MDKYPLRHERGDTFSMVQILTISSTNNVKFSNSAVDFVRVLLAESTSYLPQSYHCLQLL